MLFRAALLAVTLAAAPAAMAAPVGVQMAQVEIQPHGMMPIQDRRDRGGPREVLPLREVVDMVRSRFGGDLINARLEQGQRPVYVLRWRMPNNDVRDVRVDAVSGQMR
ncbi:MAG: hypothetical protein NW206_04275 [Hyphomonadaceae bacterium]|nr:hypothetical protein [Hyphomonadaceae bacterium]